MTRRRTGIALLIAAGVCVIVGLGLAFTIFGELALVLAVICVIVGAVLISTHDTSSASDRE